MNERYSNILSALYGTVWHIQTGALQAMLDIVEMRVRGERLTDPEIEDRVSNARKSQTGHAITGGVAIMKVLGPLVHRAGNFDRVSGLTSTERMGKDFDALAADASIGAIVLDLHSPGGSHYGLEEISDRIYAARNGKRPIIAIANDLAASAAYWIASAADEVWVTPGGLIGSVGTMLVHRENSAMQDKMGIKTTLFANSPKKIEGNSDQPLTEDASKELQRMVDDAADEFVAGVARNRGRSADTVLEKFGSGRVFSGEEAIRRGIADKVGTLDQVMESLGVRKATSSKTEGEPMDVHHSVSNRRRRQELRQRAV